MTLKNRSRSRTKTFVMAPFDGENHILQTSFFYIFYFRQDTTCSRESNTHTQQRTKPRLNRKVAYKLHRQTEVSVKSAWQLYDAFEERF